MEGDMRETKRWRETCERQRDEKTLARYREMERHSRETEIWKDTRERQTERWKETGERQRDG